MKKVKSLGIYLILLLIIMDSLAAADIGIRQPVFPDPPTYGNIISGQALIEAPPTGTIFTPAEYGPIYAPLITWGVFTELMVPFIAGVTAGDTDSFAYIMVNDSGYQQDAVNTLTAAGVDLDRVKFIEYGYDTNWLRDYGPRCIKVNGQRALVDYDYFDSRPKDDAMSEFLGTYWGMNVYHWSIYQQGGNFLTFTNGDAFATRGLLDGNSEITEAQFIELYRAYFNVNLTFFDTLPGGVDATNHIDMWFCPVGDYKVIIGKYDPAMPGYAETEAAAAIMTARGYTVYRVPNYNDGVDGIDGTHFTYTNCVIINNKAYIPKFNHADKDAEAVSVFQQALPAHQIIALDMTDIIGYYGALHCTMQHIYPPTDTFVEVVTPNGGKTYAGGDIVPIKWIALANAGISTVDIAYSTNGGTQFTNIITNHVNTRSYSWVIPRTNATNCLVRVIARDAANNTVQDLSDTSFTIIQQPTATPRPTRTPSASPSPTPKGTPANGKADVNSDGTITIVDALMTAQYSVGLNPPNFLATAADVDGNAVVNIVDALMIAQYYVGLISL